MSGRDAIPESAPGGSNFATFGRRFAAWVVDTALLAVAVQVVAALAERLVPDAWEAGPGVFTTAAFVGLAIQLAYLIGFTSRGATPGKMVLGIFVIDAAGRPPGWVRAATRYLLFLASSIGLLAADASVLESSDGSIEPGGGGLLIFLLVVAVNLYDHLSMLWHPQNQTVHDRIAGTWVVRRSPAEPA